MRSSFALAVLSLDSIVGAALAGAGIVDWSGVEAVLNDEVAKKSFPGCAASVSVGDSSGDSGATSLPVAPSEWSHAFGHLTYPDSSNGSSSAPTPVDLDSTRYDMASLTKARLLLLLLLLCLLLAATARQQKLPRHHR